jgi:sporulation protein YlmC with PRC-barrel domain
MATLDNDRILRRRGDDLYDRDGDKIGNIEEIYLDAETDRPAWAVVQTGLLGTRRTFVPLRDAIEEEGVLTVPYEKDAVKNAPQVEHDGAISKDEEAALMRHYDGAGG